MSSRALKFAQELRQYRAIDDQTNDFKKVTRHAVQPKRKDVFQESCIGLCNQDSQ